MWDRISNSTSAGATPPQSRPYSPAPPRRNQTGLPNPGQRPDSSFSARSSSLSLISNDSATSLLASKKTNGSALKQSTTIVNAPNPLDVLEKLLGVEGSRVTEQDPGTNGVHHDGQDEAELDFGGLGLHELALTDISGAGEKIVYNSQTIEECMYSQISTHKPALIISQTSLIQRSLTISIDQYKPVTTY